LPDIPPQWFESPYETIERLLALLKEWEEDKTNGPWFHEDEHGPESLLNRTRDELYLSS